MRYRFAILTILLAIWVALPVSGQSNHDVCGTLPDTDCDLLLRSQQTMADLGSQAFLMEFDLELIEANGDEILSMRMIVDGSYVLDDQWDAPATGIVEYVANLLRGANVDMNVMILFSDEADLQDELGIDGPITFDLRLVDGFGYINIGKILGTSNPVWYGLDLVEFFIVALDEGGISPTSPVPLGEGGGTGMLGGLVEMGGDFVRLEDADGLAHFEASVTGEQIFADDELKTEVITGIYLMLMQESGLSPFYDSDELMESAEAYANIVQYLAMSSRRAIDTETGYLHRMTFTARYTPDRSIVDAFRTAPDPLFIGQELDTHFNFDFVLNNSRFNAVEPAPEPEDPIIFSVDDIMNLAGMGSNM